MRSGFVTRPSAVSTVDDICFSCGPREMELQFAGGLRATDIVAMFTDAAEARARARQELRNRDAFLKRIVVEVGL